MSLFARLFADVRTVQLTPWGAVSRPDPSIGIVYAEAVLQPDGQLRYTANGITGVTQELRAGEWITPANAGIGALYEACITNETWDAGPYGNAATQGTPANTWTPISSDVWRRLSGDNSSRWSKFSFDLQIRAVGSTLVLAQARITLSQDARSSNGGVSGGAA